jgi:sigma-B regulation protein RsbU (phosphoserine phosphatase)
MIYVADFTGHGVAAALNTARFHSFVHISCERTDKSSSLLRRLNRRLYEVLPVDQFATMFCAAIDFNMQSIEYASAGAPPQFYRRSSKDPFEIISQPSLPLGIVRDMTYESRTVAFLPGGGLALYTDGLIETPKPPQNLYTPESLKELLNNSNQSSVFQLCQGLVGELFSNPAVKAEDDITLIIAKHTGAVMEAIDDYEI